METTIHRMLRVKAKEEVELKLTIGNGQLGTTSVHLGADLICDETKSRITLSLGKGKNLRRKQLRCSTLVQDINASTNKTSVAYRFNGSYMPYEEKLTKTVAEEGEIVWYTATFNFY